MTRVSYLVASVVVVIVFMLYGVPAMASSATLIVLAEEAWVTGNDIFLGDVASFQGESDVVAKLEQVNIGRAPVAGQNRRLTKGHIEVRLRQAGIEPRTLEFQGAPSVQIYTGAATTPLPEQQTYSVVTVTR